jgi:FkbM family methyltransferase
MRFRERVASKVWHLRSDWYTAHSGTSPFKASVTTETAELGDGTNSYTVATSRLKQGGVAYSCGVGTDISFDRELISRFQMEVHAFDPTPEAAEWIAGQALPAGFTFHPWAVCERDGPVALATLKPASSSYRAASLLRVGRGERITGRGMSLGTIRAELGHDRIALLKVDIEGGEFVALDTDALDHVDQIVLEIHPHLAAREAHRDLLVTNYGWQRCIHLIERIIDRGFELFWVSERGTELGLVRI